jgi:hypothetical protein
MQRVPRIEFYATANGHCAFAEELRQATVKEEDSLFFRRELLVLAKQDQASMGC